MELLIVVCAASPAGSVGELIRAAQDDGWTCRVLATPSALRFLDVAAIEALTKEPVRHAYRAPDEPKTTVIPDVAIVAPATFNSVNKLAAGITDTYALGVLAEVVGLGVPTVVVPFLSTVLAGRLPFRNAVESLRAEGVTVLVAEHPHGEGGSTAFPWRAALAEATRP
ncbi:flavoprotein [Longispora sp. NPDC051575]|uniref:flavoprotein n=1 Tax=Longispora sp. NPDC051575 TaxID=3154943 RepID=UPI0034349048